MFQDEHIPTKFVQAAGKQIVACFIIKTDCMVTGPLKERRTVYSHWYITIYLAEVLGEIKKTNKSLGFSLSRPRLNTSRSV